MFDRRPLRIYIMDPKVSFDDKIEALQAAAYREWATCPIDDKNTMLSDLNTAQSHIPPLKMKNKELNEKLYVLRTEFTNLKNQVDDSDIIKEVEQARPVNRLFYPIDPFNPSSVNNMPVSLLFLKAETYKTRCLKYELIFDNTRLTNLIGLLERANKILNEKLDQEHNRLAECKN